MNLSWCLKLKYITKSDKMKTKYGVKQELFYTKPMQEIINLERAPGGVWL